MRRSHHVLSSGLLAASLAIVGAGRARGQGPTINPDAGGMPGGPGTLLGQTPGAGASAGGGVGQGAQYLGGRPGATAPHTPTSVTNPTPSPSPLNPSSIAPPQDLQPAGLPIYGTLAVPRLAEDEGPADGLTLDGAIERYVRENLDLRARFMEIPQAEADILTASLRSNPVFYADSQLVPYGQYSNARPGGQTQYDVNISYPLDLTHKRRARHGLGPAGQEDARGAVPGRRPARDRQRLHGLRRRAPVPRRRQVRRGRRQRAPRRPHDDRGPLQARANGRSPTSTRSTFSSRSPRPGCGAPARPTAVPSGSWACCWG